MRFYFDMDGVVAKYERTAYMGDNPMYLRKNSHYFRYLQPDHKAIDVLRKLSEQSDIKTYILTSVTNIGSIYKEHIDDKMEWLQKYCPFIDIKNQFIATVSAKPDIINMLQSPHRKNITKTDILIDDFNKNLNEWTLAGGIAVKYLNGVNSPNAKNPNYTYDGINLTQDMTSDEIVEVLLSLNLPTI